MEGVKGGAKVMEGMKGCGQGDGGYEGVGPR